MEYDTVTDVYIYDTIVIYMHCFILKSLIDIEELSSYLLLLLLRIPLVKLGEDK